MSLIRKHTVYKLSLFVWTLVAFGAAILVASGNAKPYVSLSDVPTGTPFPLFGGALVALLLGGVVVGRLSRRDWERAGRRAGLSPAEGGLTGKPDLEGTVRGRTVRVRTVKRETSSSSTNSGSSSATYTVVEVDLTDPVDDGIMIQATGDTTVFGGGGQVENRSTDIDGFGVIGAEENFARAVLTDEVREELRSPSELNAVFVGDVSEALMAVFQDSSGPIVGMLAGRLEGKAEQGISGDGTTARVQQKGVLLDGTELTRQIDALVTVTESFEAARASHGNGRRRRSAGGEGTIRE